MDLDGLKHMDTLALQLLGVAATTSMVVRVIILVCIDDIYEIIERYRRHKRADKAIEEEKLKVIEKEEL